MDKGVGTFMLKTEAALPDFGAQVTIGTSGFRIQLFQGSGNPPVSKHINQKTTPIIFS